MGVRGLFLILIMSFLFYYISGYIDPNNRLAFVIFGILFGWGLDYFIEIFKKKKIEVKNKLGNDKILDSSVIIDGRILDIIDTGFIEGDIIIPQFVLNELQLLADSSDSLKRARGKRGLDLIKLLKEKNKNKIIIEKIHAEGKDVDSKLIELTKTTNSDLITTDFNLNKVASLQGIKVLNINTLSNALKPMVIPNEELEIELIKQGDRDGQAVGYLSDGTMVVAEDGGSELGKRVILLVTSVYPTAAGRMIFGKVKK